MSALFPSLLLCRDDFLKHPWSLGSYVVHSTETTMRTASMYLWISPELCNFLKMCNIISPQVQRASSSRGTYKGCQLSLLFLKCGIRERLIPDPATLVSKHKTSGHLLREPKYQGALSDSQKDTGHQDTLQRISQSLHSCRRQRCSKTQLRGWLHLLWVVRVEMVSFAS